MSNFYVFDTNVIVSAAIFPQSIPRMSIDKAFIQGTVLISDSIEEELTEVLQRKKFDRYASFELRYDFLENFLLEALFIYVDQNIQACRDTKDNKFLELAVCGKATVIISGDQDLLVLNPFRGIAIITPQDFFNF
ncbi:putative toxin-antitoxin system toxin component, PIN family [Aphanothece hegewaldii CCALA 016]|uniref:Putative toxin-antitoxin system toxin component, PIN family n=2 Tax=Aphanothece TaxID=1121 RepID=A0A2T1LUF3_9CHRO|nr:putative toxin-antitoxin system toxin component, PIN family [Aphanothece hegewaldii CCALA 016]